MGGEVMDLSEGHLLQKHDRYSQIRVECVDTKSQAEEPMILVLRMFSGQSHITTYKTSSLRSRKQAHQGKSQSKC